MESLEMDYKEQITSFRQQGLTYQKIGTILHLTRQRIHQIHIGYKSKAYKHDESISRPKKIRIILDPEKERIRARDGMRRVRQRRKTITEKNCKFCSLNFIPLHKRLLYCSDVCKKTAVKKYTKEIARKMYDKNRTQAIEHYSNGKNCCSCCGESNYNFLTLDHIIAVANANPGAWKTRLRSPFYLKQKGWPSGIQVLCYNCNYGKRREETCPHKWQLA